MEQKIECLLDGHHGVYLPQVFAQQFDMFSWGCDDDQREILLDGPDNDDYWDVWEEVLMTARMVDDAGMEWTLDHDGDLFAIRDDYDDDDESMVL